MDNFSVLGKRIMDSHKIGKSELSRIMCSSRSTVYLWLEGASCPSYDQVMLLMDHLGKRVIFIDEDLL
jgi:hypothetical protein